jgi:hypothetical protein
VSGYYTVRYQLANGDWNWMNTSNEARFHFPTLQRAEESIQKTVSLDYVIEGEMYDDQGTIVQRWVAGVYRSQARRVETVCDATAGEPGVCQKSG